MTLEQLYERVKAKAKANGDESAFKSYASTPQIWIIKSFKSESSTETTFNNLISLEVLSDEWNLSQFYRSFLCNRTDLSWVRSSAGCTTSVLEDYVGEYEWGVTTLEISEETGSLFAEISSLRLSTELQKESKDKFTTEDDSANFKFIRDSNNVIIKVRVKWKSLSALFLKKIKSSKNKKTEDNVWQCIDNYNEIQQYYPLNGSIGGDYKFQLINYQYDGRDTKIEFYKDFTVLLKFDDNDQVVPGGKGTWSCGKDNNSYYIKWESGKISEFGGRVGGEVFNTGTKTDTQKDQKNTPSLIEACTSLKPCPTVEQVKKGKAFKQCMKCDEIKKLQNSPLFQRYYFRKLKENNKPEIADGIFGPIMKQAVLEYQTTYGIRTKSGAVTGMIGPKTYASLVKDIENSENVITPTNEPKAETTPQPKKIPLANQETEF